MDNEEEKYKENFEKELYKLIKIVEEHNKNIKWYQFWEKEWRLDENELFVSIIRDWKEGHRMIRDWKEGHRMIRDWNFEIERKTEVNIDNFTCEELKLFKNRILKYIEFLEHKNVECNDVKLSNVKLDIIDDIGILKNYVSKISIMEIEIDRMNKKYKWNKDGV